MQFWCLPHLYRFTLDFVSVCTVQYAEFGLIFTMPFVGIRIILVLSTNLAVSKSDEILSLGAGDQFSFIFFNTHPHHPLILPHTTHTIPPSREGKLEVWDEKENWKMKNKRNKAYRAVFSQVNWWVTIQEIKLHPLPCRMSFRFYHLKYNLV